MLTFNFFEDFVMQKSFKAWSKEPDAANLLNILL